MDKKLQDKRESFVKTIRKETKTKMIEQRRSQIQNALTAHYNEQTENKFIEYIREAFTHRTFECSFYVQQVALSRLVSILWTQYSLQTLNIIADISQLPSQNVSEHLVSLEHHSLLVQLTRKTQQHCRAIIRIAINSMMKRSFWRSFKGLLSQVFITSESFGMNKEIMVLAAFVITDAIDPNLQESDLQIIKRSIQYETSKSNHQYYDEATEISNFIIQNIRRLNFISDHQQSDFR